MRSRFRPHLTYANVMATIAVFLALGGGAVAATSFIGTDGRIHGCVTKSGQLTLVKRGKECGKGKTKIAWNQRGPRGLRGSNGSNGHNGSPGANGATNVAIRIGEATSFDHGGQSTAPAACHVGERAVGGGARISGFTTADRYLSSSYPMHVLSRDLNGNPTSWESVEGETPDGWAVTAYNNTLSDDTLKATVECASP